MYILFSFFFMLYPTTKNIIWSLPDEQHLTLLSITSSNSIENPASTNPLPFEDFAKAYNLEPNKWEELKNLTTCISKSSCCSCDVTTCVRFKTCCLDLLWIMYDPRNISDFKDEMKNMLTQRKEYKCETLLPLENKANEEMYLMIVTCLPNAKSQDKDNCLNPKNKSANIYRIPVIGYDGYLYRNVYCAACNFITSYKPVVIEAVCGRISVISQLNDDELRKRCKFEINLDEADKFKRYIKRCHLNSSALSKEIVVRQKDFLSCNVRESESRKCLENTVADFLFSSVCDSCGLRIQSVLGCTDKDEKPLALLVPWSMLISFTKDLRIKEAKDFEAKSIIPICNGDEIFENFQASCRKKSSSNPDKLMLAPHNSSSNPIMLVPPNHIKSLSGFKEFDHCLASKNPSIFVIHNHMNGKEREPVNYTKLYQFRDLKINIYRIEKNLSIHTYIENMVGKHDFGLKPLGMKDSFIISLEKNVIINRRFNVSFPNAFENGRICYKYIALDLKEVSFTDKCEVQIRNETLPKYKINMWLKIWHDDNLERNQLSDERNIGLCQQFYLHSNCALKSINESDITVHTNGSIRTVTDDKLYEANEYIPLVSGVGVCASKVSKVTSHTGALSSLQTVDIYVSYIGTSVSVIGYIAIIATFSLMNVRNVPGLCTTTLIVSLLIGDSMFLAGGLLNYSGNEHVFALCKTIGILMHCGLLSSFTWCIIIAFDLWTCFTNLKSVKNERSKKKFVYYLYTSSFTTFFIVITATALDQIGIVHIGYGMNGICAPQYLYGRLYFYIIPAGISFVVSMLLLITTICKISRDARKNKRVLRHSGQKNMNISLLAFKLVAVLGITEGIGFIQLGRSDVETKSNNLRVNQVIGLVYSTVRSLRGVFMLFVYVCRKDVLSRLYNLVHHREKRETCMTLSDFSLEGRVAAKDESKKRNGHLKDI